MTTQLHPDNIVFVMVRPVYLGNIGSAARLLKNFGFSQLRLVDAPKNYKDAEARKMAVGAFDILKETKTFETLEAALEDMNMVVGTSAGQQRALQLLPLAQAVERVRECAAPPNKIAIVLGDERNGLSNNELNACHLLVKIETMESFPSLNVAQAACVIAYELSKACNSEPAQAPQMAPELLPTTVLSQELFDQIGSLLEQVQFSRRFNKDVVTNELRRFYYKAAPTKREAELLKGVLYKLNQALETLEKVTSGPDSEQGS